MVYLFSFRLMKKKSIVYNIKTIFIAKKVT